MRRVYQEDFKPVSPLWMIQGSSILFAILSCVCFIMFFFKPTGGQGTGCLLFPMGVVFWVVSLVFMRKSLRNKSSWAVLQYITVGIQIVVGLVLLVLVLFVLGIFKLMQSGVI